MPAMFQKTNVDLVTDSPKSGNGNPPASAPQTAPGQDVYEFAYLDLRACMERIRNDIQAEGSFDIKSIFDRIAFIAGNPDALFGLYKYTSLYGNEADYIPSHLINVMIYSMRIGRKMDYPTDELVDIGLAAALHDAGMFQVAPEILAKPAGLSPEETAQVQRHTVSGSHIFDWLKASFPLVSRVAAEHHEREDGSGYPAGLSGQQIHPYAKIVALADTYEAMTHDRPHRKAVSVRRLLDSRESLTFSREVMKAFLEAMQVYPIGSLVLLNSGFTCRVVDSNIDNPLKPVVRQEFDDRGRPVQNGQVLNLKEKQNLLWIVKAIDGDAPAR